MMKKEFSVVMLAAVALLLAAAVADAQESMYGHAPVLPNVDGFSEFSEVPVLNQSGKRLPEELREYVTILGNRYEVMRPWQRHRIDLSLNSDGKNLVRLPAEFSFEESKIYVTAPAHDAFLQMAQAAMADGVFLQVDSGYRSLLYQRSIYVRQLQEGKDFYDIAKGVAPPGYSEHMTGTAFDLVPSDWSFHGSAAEGWLMANAGRFHFVQTYGEFNKEGFVWEPWHWRFTGETPPVAKAGKNF